MKKSILVTLAFSASLLGALSLSDTTANAASYHNGIPHVLKNTKWHGKTITFDGHHAHSTLKFKSTSLDYFPALGPGAQGTFKIKYKYTGHGTYYLTGRVYNNAPKGGVAWKYKVIRSSSHKLYLKDYTNGITTGHYYR
ncbi:hypothetical protein [Secundilactobacillus yichangensis]|uniref:hypothetical protein n=1 Tax=Secundilactobacillus yichangensis TaxID=2799580 RepID=UPI001941C5EC|nr:hypothetical protein [Secundilactobacillus yichangensis]